MIKKITSAWDEADFEEDVYSEDGIDMLENDDEISPAEAAFMRGWAEA